jgi:hypothetical protein
VKGIELAKTFSALKKMRNDELSDQLKIWKLVEKDAAVKKTTGTRTELVLALQPLILGRFGAKAITTSSRATMASGGRACGGGERVAREGRSGRRARSGWCRGSGSGTQRRSLSSSA